MAGSEGTAVLLVGEGNLTFAAALAHNIWGPGKGVERREIRGGAWLERTLGRSPLNADSTRLTATTFDDLAALEKKYQETPHVLRRLQKFSQNVTVRHQVNATRLVGSFAAASFDLVVWNHPHLGIEDFRLHKFLVSHFFLSAAQVLRAPRGRVSVTVVAGQAQRWNLVTEAARHGLKLVACEPFDWEEFPGFESKRNYTGQSFQNAHTRRHCQQAMGSQRFLFAMDGAAPPPLGAAAAAAPLQERPCEAAGGAAEDPSWRCEKCGKTFQSAQGRKTHFRQVHELNKYGAEWEPHKSARLPCGHPGCSKRFRDGEAKWQHEAAVHGVTAVGGRTDVVVPSAAAADGDGDAICARTDFEACEVCGMAVLRHESLDAHLRTFEPLLRREARCEKCQRIFSESRALQQHLNFCINDAARPNGGKRNESLTVNAKFTDDSETATALVGAKR